ncbi:MAG: hypothetical protein QOG57_2263, partial [Pseudonocardiales bacterium]|nr:hypothetical protein [Pseudonocardiales bacterium]
MRILVLGGTVFLSHAVAVEALARGHRVSCLARGVSGSVPAGARLLVADRDSPGALAAAVGGESFDAVVDVATMSLPWVSEALAALAGSVAHWTFISSINVYADKATPGQGVDAPLLSPYVSSAGAATPAVDPDLYGAAKVASENAVLSALGERAFVVRAGLLVGPGDPHDRFGYWPARFSRGGRAIVPDALDQPLQYLDVRDLAAWVVSAAERGLGGVFDGAGPRRTLGEVLRGIASAVGGSAVGGASVGGSSPDAGSSLATRRRKRRSSQPHNSVSPGSSSKLDMPSTPGPNASARALSSSAVHGASEKKRFCNCLTGPSASSERPSSVTTGVSCAKALAARPCA